VPPTSVVPPAAWPDSVSCAAYAPHRRLALHDRDPAGLRERRRVHEVHPLGRRRLEQPAEDRGDERRPIDRGELARDLERQRPDAGPAELGEEPAERLGERQVRREGLGRLGVTSGAFTA
jgi:hypothetical protein